MLRETTALSRPAGVEGGASEEPADQLHEPPPAPVLGRSHVGALCTAAGRPPAYRGACPWGGTSRATRLRRAAPGHTPVGLSVCAAARLLLGVQGIGGSKKKDPKVQTFASEGAENDLDFMKSVQEVRTTVPARARVRCSSLAARSDQSSPGRPLLLSPETPCSPPRPCVWESSLRSSSGKGGCLAVEVRACVRGGGGNTGSARARGVGREGVGWGEREWDHPRHVL